MSPKILDIGYELTLVPGDLKHYFCPPVRAASYGIQVINDILAQVHLTVVQCVPKPILWLLPRFQNEQLEKTYLALSHWFSEL